MDPIDRIIIDYKRGEKNMVDEEDVRANISENAENGDADDIDVLAITMCDELITELKRDIQKCSTKAFRLRALDTLFYLTTHVLSFTVFVIGLYQGAKASEDGDSKWFYITSILVGVGALVIEIGKRCDFKAKSVLMYESVQKYEAMSLELRELRVSPMCGNVKIVKVREMEDRASAIQVNVFS